MLSISELISIILGKSGPIHYLVVRYGYEGITLLMALESASLPIPSEVILPLAGHYASIGLLNYFGVLAVATIGGIIGITVDYAIAFYIGKDVVYRNLKFFHIKKESMDNFIAWFDQNGSFAVFVVRLIPVIRGLISFAAGFAEMKLKKFYVFSILGSLVWDIVLVTFGFYALSGGTFTVIEYAAILAFALYVVYLIFSKKMKVSGKPKVNEDSSTRK
jgi:membrane protein DedA with SNARE-associated domain